MQLQLEWDSNLRVANQIQSSELEEEERENTPCKCHRNNRVSDGRRNSESLHPTGIHSKQPSVIQALMRPHRGLWAPWCCLSHKFYFQSYKHPKLRSCSIEVYSWIIWPCSTWNILTFSSSMGQELIRSSLMTPVTKVCAPSLNNKPPTLFLWKRSSSEGRSSNK
mgnify:CR=1 FL=1